MEPQRVFGLESAQSVKKLHDLFAAVGNCCVVKKRLRRILRIGSDGFDGVMQRQRRSGLGLLLCDTLKLVNVRFDLHHVLSGAVVFAT